MYIPIPRFCSDGARLWFFYQGFSTKVFLPRFFYQGFAPLEQGYGFSTKVLLRWSKVVVFLPRFSTKVFYQGFAPMEQGYGFSTKIFYQGFAPMEQGYGFSTKVFLPRFCSDEASTNLIAFII